MKRLIQSACLAASLLAGIGVAYAGKYTDTMSLFKNAGESADFFDHSYGYAVFPTVGEGGFGVAGALGKGHVYVHGLIVGDTTMKQVSVGFQAGGKAYSQIIFFKDRRALEQFESGSFEFSAGASAVAITAAASASAATNGTSSSLSGGKRDAKVEGNWNDGMAVFTIAKGGLMYAAAVAGQKFSFHERTAG
jgi:lipid-binding SYLF domain-containing protein